ncbi:MAG: lysophospholipid acyltransferase family protein [Limnohabitans sp.]|nr:lysophospholipid acyltransferase family protein [Limnohabitans sp.]
MLRFFRLLSWIPLPLMQRVGALLGWIVWWISPKYRQQFNCNSVAAGLNAVQTRPAIAAAGMMVAELPWLWTRSVGRSVLSRVQWLGVNRFEQAIQKGQGVILLSTHIGCWEMGAQALAEKLGPIHGPLVAMYRPARKPWLYDLVKQSRARDHLLTAPTSLSGIRTLVRTLKSGGYTAILPDQVPPDGQGVWAPFFGRDVYTMTLLSKLAQQTGATVLLSWCERLPHSQYCFHFEDVDLSFLSDSSLSMQESATLMNKAIEDLIRRKPDQYLWGYARDKHPRGGDT